MEMGGPPHPRCHGLRHRAPLIRDKDAAGQAGYDGRQTEDSRVFPRLARFMGLTEMTSKLVSEGAGRNKEGRRLRLDSCVQ